MSSFLNHGRSFVAECSAAGISALLMYGVLRAALRYLEIDNPATDFLVTCIILPFPLTILFFKTVFPRTVSHRSYRLPSYILLSQWLMGLGTAILLEAIGECQSCRGNVHDIIFYAIVLGTPYGVLYAAFSKIFSIDVDIPVGGS